jgi:aspartate carbamoyltransferase catalytic subunit
LIWSRKHLLALEGLTRKEICAALDEARKMKALAEGRAERRADLAGSSVVSMFFEPSAWTATAMALAARRLGAETVSVPVGRARSPVETVRGLEDSGAAVFVLRHPSPGAARALAGRTSAAVINAGDGCHEHPLQGLVDLHTVREELGRVEGLAVGLLGDVRHSRAARSDLWGFRALGARVLLVGPPTLVPRELSAFGVEVHEDLDAVLPELDAVVVQRLRPELHVAPYLPGAREYSRGWGLNAERLASARPGLLVLHPGPLSPGSGVTSEVIASQHSMVARQAANGLAVSLAALRLVTGNAGREDHG